MNLTEYKLCLYVKSDNPTVILHNVLECKLNYIQVCKNDLEHRQGYKFRQLRLPKTRTGHSMIHVPCEAMTNNNSGPVMTLEQFSYHITHS